VAQTVGIPVQDSNDVDALARSVLYETLALGLQAPTRDTLARIESEEARRTLTLAAETVDPEGSSGLADAVVRLTGLPPANLDDLAVRHSQLFGHTARGPVCPFETEYGTDALFRQPQELAHIAGYYAAFGLKPRAEDGERVDHVSCECEFFGFLCRKEAFALSAGPEAAGSSDVRLEMLDTTRKATRSFFKDHLGRFGTAFGLRLSREDAGGAFGLLAELLVTLLQLESERLGVTLGAATLDLRSTAEDEVPMGCGSGEQLVQLQTRRNIGQNEA
jgi:TorA maturation chaperone TorD